MKYRQLDKILVLEPGVRLVGQRKLDGGEEYLLDHFPRFPVMPGVMMLEALQQAGAWLIRVTDDFRHPLVLLREVRSVKFGDFLIPGETLLVTAEIVKQHDGVFTVKATGSKEDKVTVSARLIFECRFSGDPERLGTDEDVSHRVRKQFKTLFGDSIQVSV
jgi:3-hydroxyacyl-[acyl-carrier-protein] dehydratase